MGLVSGSLALISDAGHMAADVVALGASLASTRIATRPDRSGRRTYGSYRAEVFASGLTVLIMLGVGVYVLVEGISRIGQAPEVTSGAMLVVGFLGLAINVASLLLLRGGSKESLNVRGAYFEVIADAAGSVGVLVAGVLIIVTGEPVWDVVVAVAIAIFVIVRAVVLGRQVLAVLGQHAPEGIDPEAVAACLDSIDGVAQVHDVHLWALTSGMNVAPRTWWQHRRRTTTRSWTTPATSCGTDSASPTPPCRSNPPTTRAARTSPGRTLPVVESSVARGIGI